MTSQVRNTRSQSTGIPGRVRSLLRSVTRAKWALADQIVVSGFNFLTNVLLARVLGIEEFGRYVLAWTIVLFVQSLQFSTISTTMLSIGPKHEAEAARSYFGAVFVHQAIFGVVSAALTLAGGYIAAIIFPTPRLDTIALPLAVAVLFSQTQDFLRRYFFAIARPNVSFAIDVIRYIGQSIAIAALISWLPANAAAALWLVGAAAVIGTIAAVPYVPPLKYSFSIILSAGLRGWHFSKWLIASTLLLSLFTSMFSFAAGILLGAAAVGGMRAAFATVSIANIVIEASVNVITAGASRKFTSDGSGGLNEYLRKVAVYGTLAVASLMVVLLIDPKFWLHLFFGSEFKSYWILIPWYAIYQVLIFLGVVIGTWYRTLENTRSIFYPVAFSVVISLAVAYPLITNFGVSGAAAGLLIGQIAQVAFMLLGIRLVKPR